MQCFKEEDVDPTFYTTRARSDEEIFPWDFISCGVTKAFLLREWKKALAAEVSANCRAGCQGCGAGTYGVGVCPGHS
jgi:hypothetical protein